MTCENHDRSFPLDAGGPETPDLPPGADSRAFLMRSAVAGTAAMVTGCNSGEQAAVPAPASAPPQAVLF